MLSYEAMIKEKLLTILKVALAKTGIKEEAELQQPIHIDHGDYSTAIALKYAKKLKKDPLSLAKDIAKNIRKTDFLEKVDVVKPGFINFFIAPSALLEKIKNPPKSEQKNYKILLEFGQPNTHKDPHIGHLFSYIFGESLSRLLKAEGNNVFKANYQGDVGLHVAKCLYVARGKMQETRNKSLREKVKFLQTCYQEGSELYEKDKKIEKEIDALNLQIYQNDPAIYDVWEQTRKWSLEFYKQFEKKIGIHYDKYYFESETAKIGKSLVEKNTSKVFEKSDDAVIYKGEKHGLHTRVFITKLGNPTYEAKDLGLVALKKKDFPFDLSIVTTASEQNAYFKVVIAASEDIFPQLKKKLIHLGYGMINLITGKMSSRKGDIVDAFELVDEVTETIQSTYKISQDLAEKIALSSIKYSFLRSDAYKDIVFDMKKSIAKEGDSGPYLLYTYVRTKSILEKEKPKNASIPKNLNEEERELLKKLSRFSEAVQKAAQLYAPHLIAHYLFDLSQTFNLFYQKHPVLRADEETKQFRLTLTKVVGETVKKGLHLLGIETVEKM